MILVSCHTEQNLDFQFSRREIYFEVNLSAATVSTPKERGKYKIQKLVLFSDSVAYTTVNLGTGYETLP